MKLNNYLAQAGEEEDEQLACSSGCSRRFGNGLLGDVIMAAFIVYVGQKNKIKHPTLFLKEHPILNCGVMDKETIE